MNDTAGIAAERLREIVAGCEGVQGGPWKLDKFAAYVWAPSEKGGDFPLMDEPAEYGRVVELRGWGYYTGHGQGALGLSPEEGRERQRLTGAHIARLDPQTVSSMASELLAARQEIERLTGPLNEWLVAATKDKSIIRNPAFAESDDIAWLVKNTRAALSAKETRNAE